MSNENINEIITRQDKQAEEIEALQHKLELYEFELESLLHKIPTQKFFDEHFSDKADKKEDPFTIFQRIAKFWLDNPDKAKQISKELNNCNEYLEFKNKQAVYEKIKVTYYKKLYSYWKMVNEDRTSVFSAAYLNLMDELADRGWFLYYLQTPDILIEEKTPDEAESMLAIIYGENNCAYITHLFKDIITVDTTNELRKNKANDLREALKCLMNGAYQSCARTMFAILENEHQNASNLITRSHGYERAKEISKYVQDMEMQLRQADPHRIFITHSGCEEAVIRSVEEYLKGLHHFEEILITRAGGVISSHCGPGTLGVLFYEKG